MERLLTLYSEVQSTDVRWLWYPFIAIGKITLLQGDPGDGKSTMMMNLIAELSTGGKTPDGCKIGAPQKVIYQCSEDGVSDTIKPRLERCGADCRKIAFINEEVYNGLTLDDERILQTLNWKMNCRYQCRGICRGQGNAKFLIFELDESRILTGKNQYEQENCLMNLKCRLYRSKWVQSITVSDVMESGQVVENPMIGAIPSRNEVQRELNDLLMSM